MNSLTKLVCLISVFGLSGCGGGSDGVVNDGDFQAAPTTFDTLAATGRSLASSIESLDATPIRSMPTSGSARFNGIGAYSASESSLEGVLSNPDTLSKVTIDANFATSKIQGRTYDFRSADGGKVDGSLNISNGKINQNTFTAEVGGRLNNRGVPVTYSGDVLGQFGGSKAGALTGIGQATGKAAGYADQNVTAVFVAKE